MDQSKPGPSHPPRSPRPPGADRELLAKLAGMAKTARSRAVALRARAPRAETNDAHWVSNALWEIDAAHEELRVAEEELYSQADALQLLSATLDGERRRYQALFEDAPEAYLVTDSHGVVIEANRRACQLLQTDGAFVSGKPLAVFVALEDRGLLRNVLKHRALDGTASRFELQFKPSLHARAQRTTVSLSRALGDGGSSSQLRWLIHTHDAQQAVAGAPLLPEEPPAREPAHGSAATATRDVAWLVSQELQRPLSAITSWLERLGAGQVSPAQREHAYSVVAYNTRTMSTMLEQLSDSARLRNAPGPISLQEVALPALLEDALASCQADASLSGIWLSLRVEPALPPVRVDPHRLLQIVRNLLGNALRYTPRGGRIELSADVRDAQLELTVSDTGIGIAPASQQEIFEPFVRLTHPGQRAPGLGLGLSVARQLSELHGGSLSVQSAGEGTGATFTVRLPCAGP